MKKLILIVFFAAFAMNTLPVSAKEAVAASTAEVKNNLTQSEVNSLTNRLHEIREAAKGNLGQEEKSVLRKEVMGIKERLAAPLGGGVYISAGALILIVILLIILL